MNGVVNGVVNGAWFTSWRAALRIARRETARHAGRNALIVAMLALPVFGASAADTLVASAQKTTAEQLTRLLGNADAQIQGGLAGEPVYQSPTINPDSADPALMNQAAANSNGGPTVDEAPPPTPQQLEADIRAVLPHARLLPYTHAYDTKIRTADGYLFLEGDELDFRDKATTGLLDVRSGRLPSAPGEVALSSAAAAQLGTRVGATVSVPGGSGTLTVVGIADRPDSLEDATVFALPGTLPTGSGGQPQWLVVDPGGVSWAQVEQLDTKGLLTVSRSVVLHPPPASEVPYYTYKAQHPQQFQTGDRVSATGAAIVAVTVGLVLLEVVLLAGPAFAVSARRRQREYAVIAAAGADRAHLRRIVLADGLVLGAVAGVLGTALGVGGGAAALPYLSHFTNTVPGAFRVRPLELAGIAALALVLGLASALVPARKVSRQDIVASLTGRRTPTRAAWRLPVGGLVVTGAGLVAVFFGPTVQENTSTTALIVVVGVALVEIGCIMCTPMVVGVLARTGRLLPLGPRLALRESARHRGRTTPAVAAMFAAVAGAVAAGTWFVSHDAQQRSLYQPQMLPNQVGVSVIDESTADTLAARLKTVLPVAGWFATAAANDPAIFTGGQTTGAIANAVMPSCSSHGGVVAGTLGPSVTVACGPDTLADAFTGAAIGGADVLKEVTGISDPRATAVLDQGGAVVFDPGLVHDGKVTFQVAHFATAETPTAAQAEADAKNVAGPSAIDLPAVYVDPHGGPRPPYLISPAGARKLGVSGGRESLVLTLDRHITSVELQRANRVLAEDGIDTSLVVENGYQSKLGAANLITLAVAVLVAIGAAAIATGLSLADGQPDLETLAAVGGSPATRRMVAGSTALVVTGLGALIGVPVGFAIADGLVRLRDDGLTTAFALGNAPPPLGLSTPFVVPWLNIVVAVVAVPVVTALGAAVFTRSRLQLTRRIT